MYLHLSLPNPSIVGNTPDLTDELNIYDDFSNEPLFTLKKSDHIDFDEFLKVSKNLNFRKVFSLFSLNIRSLSNKLAQLTNILAQFDYPPAIICLQEIWSAHGNIKLDGYHPLEYVSRDSNSIPNPNCGGGAGIYIRNNIEYQKISLPNEFIKGVFESVWVKIRMNDGTFKIIGSCYRPNSAPLASHSQAIKILDEIVVQLKKEHKKTKIIITGDFNMDLLKYSLHPATNEFITNFYNQGMLPLITKPTRVTQNSATLIDNIFSDDIYNMFAGLCNFDISDHETLFLIDKSGNTANKDLTLKVRSTQPKDLKKLYGNLKKHDFLAIFSSDNVNAAFENFYEVVDDLIERNLPLRDIKIKPKLLSKPWYTEGLKISNKTKLKLQRKQAQNPSENNIN